MTFDSRWLACGMCSALALAFLPSVAFGQANAPCTDIQMLQHKCGGQQKAKDQKKNNSKQPQTKYPNATRKSPKIKPLSEKLAKTLNAGLAASNNGDNTTAQSDLQPIANSSDNPYAKALATSGLAQLKYRAGDTKGAIALQKQALDSNALDNDAYFQALENLAQMYIAAEDYTDALSALDTWNKESGTQSADVYALQGNAYYRLQKFPQAVAALKKAKALNPKAPTSWDQIEMASYVAMDKYDDAAKLAEAALAKNPNDAALLQTVIAIDVNSGRTTQALSLLERARANGQIKTAAEYMDMAKMYDNIGQKSSDPKPNAMKAVGVIKEGMSKGIIHPGFDSYKLLGDSYTIAENFKEAKSQYQQAIATGTSAGKPVGPAYINLGIVEINLQNKAAAIAAFKEAAKDPATQAQAQQQLKRLEHK